MSRLKQAVLLLLTVTACSSPDRFDLVIEGGRVIDPETGLDAVRNLGIVGDTIVQVSTASLTGARVIDARGLIVAPGFIDLNRHVHSLEADRLTVLDGVTTALEFEVGVPDVRRFVEARVGRSLVHHGATASYWTARIRAWSMQLPASLNGPNAGIPPPPAGPVTNDPASVERLARIIADLRRQLQAGALGVGMGLEYTPGATRREVIEVFRLAAAFGVPVFVHARSAGQLEPGSSIESLNEVIGAAAITGASLHLVHLNSTCLRDSPECLAMISGARARGLDVTTEAYPYTAAMAAINSAFFNPGWQEKRGLDYHDIELPETNERLDRARFEVLHAMPKARYVLIHMNPDSVVDAIMKDSSVIVASDGLVSHPRVAGTFARVFARYVRDQKSLTLSEAVRKLSLLPAQRLQLAVAAARRMGRIQQGAQADIVVFDAESIQDRATFRAPTEPSVGMRYVVVGGVIVVDDGQIVRGVAPGRALLSDRHRDSN